MVDVANVVFVKWQMIEEIATQDNDGWNRDMLEGEGKWLILWKKGKVCERVLEKKCNSRSEEKRRGKNLLHKKE